MSEQKSAEQIEAERDKTKPIFYVDGVPVYCDVDFLEFLRNFTADSEPSPTVQKTRRKGKQQ